MTAHINLSLQGARDYQEDTVAHVASQAGLAAGVFDGHGGDEVSKVRFRGSLQIRISQLLTLCSYTTGATCRMVSGTLHPR
jgi:serine/threonine protein phosphatase PrpC